VGVLITTVACGDGTTPVETPAVATVALDRVSLSFAHIGERDTLRATARDQAGRPITGMQFAWASSDTTIATVDTAGAVTTLGLGTATITVTASSKQAQAQVTVAAAGLEQEMCAGGPPTVVLLVQALLRFPINGPLTRFADDLCADGYTVWLAESVPRTPPEIRAYLADAWNRSAHHLTGGLFIGDIPHAYQYVVLHSSNAGTQEEAISFQYYADVNGTFSVSPGYRSGHAYSFDVHDGDLDWELWIGVLPTYKGSTTATIDALFRYFDKNHAYRTGGPKPPRTFLQVNEHIVATTAADHEFYQAWMRNGAYSWTPFSNAATAELYFNSTTAGLTAAQGYAALRAGVADFFVQDSHGFHGAGGQLTIAIVEATPVKTIFYWSNGCAVGDLDHPDNFLTSVLYSPTSSVLVAKGTTNNSGGMGNNENGFFGHNIASSMSNGSSYGSALVAHVNVPLVSPWSQSREFHYGTAIILGDPTLELRP
jgi:hypothetical protein